MSVLLADVIRYEDTQANLSGNLRTQQLGFASDNNDLVYKTSSGTFTHYSEGAGCQWSTETSGIFYQISSGNIEDSLASRDHVRIGISGVDSYDGVAITNIGSSDVVSSSRDLLVAGDDITISGDAVIAMPNLKVTNGSSGAASPPANADNLVIEAEAGPVGITIQGGSLQAQSIAFNTPTTAEHGLIRFQDTSADDYFSINVSGTNSSQFSKYGIHLTDNKIVGFGGSIGTNDSTIEWDGSNLVIDSTGGLEIEADSDLNLSGSNIITATDGDLYTDEWQDYFSSTSKTGWLTPSGSIYYKKVGKLVHVAFYITGTSNSTSTNFLLPYYSANNSNNVGWKGAIQYQDNGSYGSTPGQSVIAGNSNTASMYVNFAGGSWTNSGSKTIIGNLWYQAA